MPASRIENVPTNIITGFLGVGKTTAIINLLKAKPSNERWAVLVNEFGEIGIDGGLYQSQKGSDEDQIYVKEVTGGCMCCSTGFAMQIALNQLLARARPHRLLIEPTGLGHPKEVLEVLYSDSYKDILSMNKTITLVDPRKLSDEKYTQNKTFNEQIAIADIVVANKVDLCTRQDLFSFDEYIQNFLPGNKTVSYTEQGEMASNLLMGKSDWQPSTIVKNNRAITDTGIYVDEQVLPEKGVLTLRNHGKGAYSIGWRFSNSHIFNYKKLSLLLSGINAERMKAVFITDEGVIAFNYVDKILTENYLDDCLNSGIEIIKFFDISNQYEKDLERKLLDCLVASI